MQRTYQPIQHMSRAEINSAITADEPRLLSCAVLSAALYDNDRQWAEDICVRLADHHDPNVRGNAILGFGHIARIHRSLNARVKPLLERALCDEDSYVRGHANDATDDVEHFLKWKLRSTV